MNTLTTAYTIASAQIDNAAVKTPSNSSWTSYLPIFAPSNNTGLPISPSIASTKLDATHCSSDGPQFIPNGVLRANVVKAESCLLMGMLQMTQESVVGYLKCGLNLRKGMI
jgi:hypothetical protein